MIIGIDFSIRSTGICILECNTYRWISVADNIKWDNKPYRHHKAIRDIDKCSVISYDRVMIPKKTEMSNDEVWCYKMTNATEHTKIITSKLTNPSGRPIIGFEGFSYGSKGNSFIDLIVYNTWLKKSLMDYYIDPSHTIPPKTLKKWFTGNGNASKLDMFNSFIASEDYLLKDDGFHKYCLSLEIGEDVPKPIEDLVDSYVVCRYLAETILSPEISLLSTKQLKY